MKGIIDYTIKRKDGTIETGREHNVIFDLPAIGFKEEALCEWVRYIGRNFHNIEFSRSLFSQFSLSEELQNLQEPSYVPPCLITTTSSSSKWYLAPLTSTNENKKTIKMATWTITEPLVLRSIQFDSSLKDKGIAIQGNSNGDKPFVRLIDHKYFLNIGADYYTSAAVIAGTPWAYFPNYADFSWSNTYFRFLRSFSNINGSYPQKPLDYVLADNSERFAFVSDANVYSPYASTIYTTLSIFDSNTDAVKRSFAATQFTDFDVSKSSYIINSGTKNWLLQYVDAASVKAWQIPDVATDNAISYISVAQNVVSTNSYVIGPYIISRFDSTARVVGRMNDDGSFTTFKGRSGGNFGSTGNVKVPKYTNAKGVDFQESLHDSWMSVAGSVRMNVNNITAANFSTPITLVAGDTLTIIYTIEVA